MLSTVNVVLVFDDLMALYFKLVLREVAISEALLTMDDEFNWMIYLGALFIRELYTNNFVGEIPKELGGLKSLMSLDLFHNNLTGPIPSSLSKLSNLKFL